MKHLSFFFIFSFCLGLEASPVKFQDIRSLVSKVQSLMDEAPKKLWNFQPTVNSQKNLEMTFSRIIPTEGKSLSKVSFTLSPREMRKGEGIVYDGGYEFDIRALSDRQEEGTKFLEAALIRSGLDKNPEFFFTRNGPTNIVIIKSSEDIQKFMRAIDDMAVEMDMIGPQDFWRLL